MQRKRLFQVFAAALALSLVAAACGGDDGDTGGPDGKAGGSAVTYLGEPDGLSPHLCGTTSCSEPANRIYDSLLEYDWKTAEPVKTGAATDYQVSADGKMVTFQLRKGATFHNGEPVNAEAFIRSYTLTARKDSTSPVAFHLDGIKGFAAMQEGTATTLAGVRQGKDEYEFVIELESANAEFFIRTGHTVFSPIPKVAVKADGTFNPAFNENPVGNGPYMMDGPWKHDVSVKIKKFEGYNGSVPGFLDSIEFKIFGGETALNTAFLEFQGGTIDSSAVPADSFVQAEKDYADSYLEQPTSVLTYLFAKMTAPPMNNVDFRRAISMAIDRDEIVTAVFQGKKVPAKSIVPPVGVPGHRPDVCKYCVFNVDQAKELLAKAGGPKSFEIAFNSGADHESWIAAVAAQLKKNLGIDTKQVGKTPFPDYLKYVESDAFQGLGRLGWAQDFPTIDNWMFPLLHSKSKPPGSNYAQFSNAEFDSVVEKAQQTLDAKERLKLQQQAEDIALDQMPIIPMFYGKSARVYNFAKFATFPLELQSGNPAWEEISIK
ncbi:MAG TPA: ABC transporter substrate-binding protein [Actinomycetota bacterium]